MENTTISIKKITRDRLRNLGTKGETWDKLLNRLLDSEDYTDPTKWSRTPFISGEK